MRTKRSAGTVGPAMMVALLASAGNPATPSAARGTSSRQPTASSSSATHLELRTDPLVELYFSIRAQAARTDAAPRAGQEQAVAAARRIQESLGSFGGWGALDAHLLDAPSPAELRRRFEDLPETMQRFGREVSIKADAVALARALEEIAPAFAATDWPARRKALDAVIARLRETFLPEHRRALAYMMRSLGIDDPGIAVPFFLVSECHPPGASSYFLGPGEPASVLGIDSLRAAGVLEETLLHEATHDLDLAARGQSTTAFEVLRDLLTARGVERRDRLYQDVPHTLMFVQAAETMRRIYDPDHVAYGEATDLYQRLGRTAEVERRIWPQVLDGKVERGEALRRIVDELAPEPAAPP